MPGTAVSIVDQITDLVHLDQCVRIQRLYAQSNKLTTLVGSSIGHFKFLRELDVSHNMITYVFTPNFSAPFPLVHPQRSMFTLFMQKFEGDSARRVLL